MVQPNQKYVFLAVSYKVKHQTTLWHRISIPSCQSERNNDFIMENLVQRCFFHLYLKEPQIKCILYVPTKGYLIVSIYIME